MKKHDGIIAVLERHGIKSASEFLAKNGDSAKVGRASAPDVRVRGSIHLMKQRKISRSQVADGFSRLKYL